MAARSTLLLLLLLAPSVVRAQRYDATTIYTPQLSLFGGMVSRGIGEWTWGREIVVRRYASSEQYPLLPILFFDAGSSWFPARYHLLDRPEATARYADTQRIMARGLSSPRMQRSLQGEKYYELLDIVGYRMRRASGSTLHVRGEYSSEPGESVEVARERAQRVRSHLTEIWGIAPERIMLDPVRRGCIDETNPYCLEEARRVVLECSDSSVLAPLQFESLTDGAMLLSLHLDLAEGSMPSEFRSVEYTLTLGGTELWHDTLTPYDVENIFRVKGVVPIHWIIAGPDRLPDSLRAQAVVELMDGRRFASNVSAIPMVERVMRGITTPRDYTSPLRPVDLSLPFHSWGDTLLFQAQREKMAGLVAQITSAAARPNDDQTIDTILAHLNKSFTLWRGGVERYRRQLKQTPILTIWATGDATERLVGDTQIDPGVMPRSSEEIVQEEALARLYDTTRPKPLLVGSVSDRNAELAWLGFDVEERFAVLQDSIAPLMERWSLARSRQYKAQPNRQEMIVKRRMSAMRTLLHTLGLSRRVRVVLSNDRYMSYFDLGLSHLPEQRLAMRSTTVVFEYPRLPDPPKSTRRSTDSTITPTVEFIENSADSDRETSRHNPWSQWRRY